MATCSEERNAYSYGKLLPPITLSNTSISNLLTLVPVLVAMTTNSSTPRFGDEDDKPPWWPQDVQWKNPRDYSYMGDILLRKLLRKVIYSCYSYHGVEDLLCRLDTSPKVEDDSAQISDIEDDENNSTTHDNDGPVFVCCFCLEEFDSHKSVSAHQRVCQDKSQSTATESAAAQDNMETFDSVQNSSETLTGPTGDRSLQSNSSNVNTQPHPVSLSVALYRLPDKDIPVEDLQNSKVTVTAQSKPTVATRKDSVKPTASSSGSSNRRQPATKAVDSILKTRSQKKMDQIMDRHNKRKMMIQECRELKEIPKSGAWWVNRKSQKRFRSSTHTHPSKEVTKHDFLSGMGLSLQKTEPEKSDASSSSKKEVDLDCEIISVEGPLSMKLPPFVPEDSNNTATSPRTPRSLMSQMSRDDSCRSARRRISSLCFVEDEWADREAINEGRDPRQMCLMTLDLSSPLGQRIRKFVKVDRPMNVVKDIELCCNTEFKDENKLRVRGGEFKVTYKKKCRATNWVHKYKFNKDQIQEFKTHMRTGLSRRSRYLKKVMSRCKVLLRQMTEKDIELYNMEKKVTIAENIVVDDDLCITQIDIPEEGLKLLKNHPLPKSIPSNNNQAGNPKFSGLRPSFSSSYNDALQNRQHRPHLPSQLPHQSRCSNPYNLPPNRHQQLSSSSSRGPFLPPRPFSLNPKSSNHCPSPPHVPNIFRNRSNSNTPSPPRTISKERRDPQAAYKQALTALQSASSHHHHHHPLHNNHQHHHQFENRHQQSHHSEHNRHQKILNSGTSSPPLGFSSGVIISERRPQQQRSVVPNANSRRKQPMNQVRRDNSSDEISSNNSHDSRTNKVTGRNETFINLADETSSQLSASSASSLSTFSNQSRPQGESSSQNSVNKTALGNTRDLSNFDHFSIRQGRITSHNSSPSIGTSNKQKHSPIGHSSSRQHSVIHSNLPNLSPFKQNHNSKGSPIGEQPHHHHHNNTQQQQQQNSNFVNKHRQQQSVGHTHQGTSRDTIREHTSSNSYKPTTGQSMNNATQRPKVRIGPKSFQMAQAASHPRPHRSSLPPSSHLVNNLTKRPAPPVDDDVMEVICIDD